MTYSKAPSVSVVVTTYEWPSALDVVLRALAEQGDDDFEVLVADDGSGPETAAIVDSWRERGRLPVTHIWQTDAGYRRARILNLAALRANGDYLLYVDGDCLPRRGFIDTLRRAMLPGWFVASKRLNLSERLSERVLAQHLPVWRWSAARWFLTAPREVLVAPRETARPGLLLPVRDRARPWRPGRDDFRPPFNGYGFCLGVARADLVRVNGFDMRFTGWGGEDVELATRLRRASVRCGWPGPRATLLHLWHPLRKGEGAGNGQLVRETETSDRVEAIVGLRQLAVEAGLSEGLDEHA